MMLVDSFQRRLDYLRVSVTDKCNLRCVYCVPAGSMPQMTHDEVLRNEEFVHFIGIFARLGVRKVRFTGGEPLLRKGFLNIVSETHRLYPSLELGLTTNGTLLEGVLGDLEWAGVSKINISLDTLSRERYRALTGHDRLVEVLANIDRTLARGTFTVKINAVLMEDSLLELEEFLQYFADRNIMMRFIERMPFGQSLNGGGAIPSSLLLGALQTKGALVRDADNDTRVAVMYTLHLGSGKSMRIGVIPSMTHRFCARCNRLRLACNGALRTCLYSGTGVDLKGPYRMDMGDSYLEELILRAVSRKPMQHQCGPEAQFPDGCASLVFERRMSSIGG